MKMNDRIKKCLIKLYDSGEFDRTRGIPYYEKLKYKKDKELVRQLKDENIPFIPLNSRLKSVWTYKALLYLLAYDMEG